MSKTVLKIENVSKLYRLGQMNTGVLVNDINRWWHMFRGKEDPYQKLAESNDRSKKGSSEYVWALKDVNLEIKQGEVVGIIGRNGAGKSTLLKLLSRTTSPTKGEIKIKGRVTSLLEVGTGFHPELTGRENVFLNGAILGMTKKEIKLKFDEIVDFSGVERYIDTPVKRYSSGMYVRLAFAVAANLETDILIIDEVLAVGDSEFQKKCLGKMKDIKGHGRTILFVSHNMTTVSYICDRGVLMHEGKLFLDGPAQSVIGEYFEMYSVKGDDGTKDPYIVPANWERPWGRRDAIFTRVEMYNSENNLTNELFYLEGFQLKIKFTTTDIIRDAVMQVRISTTDGQQISFSESFGDTNNLFNYLPGDHEVSVKLKPDLMPGNYSFYIYLSTRDGVIFFDAIPNFLKFNVKNISRGNIQYLSSKVNTFIRLSGEWQSI